MQCNILIITANVCKPYNILKNDLYVFTFACFICVFFVYELVMNPWETSKNCPLRQKHELLTFI